MGTIDPDEFRHRGRRSYEWGRLRYAAARSWPVVPLVATSAWLCHEPQVSSLIGAGLVAVLTALFWYGRIASRAASAGLRAGIGAFVVAVVGFHSYFAPYSSTLTALLIINAGTGIGVGILLSLESARLKGQRNVFLLLASAVATLCGVLGCMLFGPIGSVGMAMGILLTTAPVAIYRRALA